MKKWVKWGLVWGAIFYIITMFLFPVIDGEKFDITKILLGIPLWVMTGLILGYMFANKKKRRRS